MSYLSSASSSEREPPTDCAVDSDDSTTDDNVSRIEHHRIRRRFHRDAHTSEPDDEGKKPEGGKLSTHVPLQLVFRICIRFYFCVCIVFSGSIKQSKDITAMNSPTPMRPILFSSPLSSYLYRTPTNATSNGPPQTPKRQNSPASTPLPSPSTTASRPCA
jgi:hypothetical protein